MSKYAFLEKSLELFDEPWKGPHKEVMALYERADGLSQRCVMLSAVFENLKNIQGECRQVTSGDARHVCRLWDDWHSRTRDTIAEVMQVEEAGFPVKKAVELRERLANANSWVTSLRMLSSSLDEMANGHWLSREEILKRIS